MRKTEIVVMVKTPQPGLVKTRLIPALGKDGAAKLAERLLNHTATNLNQLIEGDASISVSLSVAPDKKADFWRLFTEKYAFQIVEQGEGDLGDRMRAEVERVCPQSGIILIGTDCPSLTSEQLLAAENALSSADIVIVPTEDGGYALIGMKHPYPELFQGITWSTSSVFQKTIDITKHLHLKVCVMPTLVDIDEPEDLQMLDENWFNY